MSREALRDAINRGFRVPINHPKVADILAVAPHLTIHEAANMLNRAHSGDMVVFIGPPLAVRGAEHVYTLRHSVDYFDSAHDVPSTLQLKWSHCYRRKESYSFTYLPATWTCIEYDYRERVSNYAESTYGEMLEWDKTFCSIQFVVMDLKVETQVAKFPVIRSEWYTGYSTAWRNITASGNPVSRVQSLCSSLVYSTTSALVSAEYEAFSRTENTLVSYNCASCGGWIDPVLGCTFCYLPVPPDTLPDYEPLHIPLPPYATGPDYRGFDIHPSNAFKKSYIDWASQGLVLPARPKEERSRLIMLEEKQ